MAETRLHRVNSAMAVPRTASYPGAMLVYQIRLPSRQLHTTQPRVDGLTAREIFRNARYPHSRVTPPLVVDDSFANWMIGHGSMSRLAVL